MGRGKGIRTDPSWSVTRRTTEKRQREGVLHQSSEPVPHQDIGGAVAGRERVLAITRERGMYMHPGARSFGPRFGHEGRPQIMLNRHLLDNGLEQNRVVGSSHRVSGAGVDLNLPRPVFEIRRFNLNVRPRQRLTHRI